MQRLITEVIFALSRCSAIRRSARLLHPADALPSRTVGAIGDAHAAAKRARARQQVPWRHVMRRQGRSARTKAASWRTRSAPLLAWTPTTSIRPYRQPAWRRVDLLRAWDTDRPSQAARIRRCRNGARPSGIGQYMPRSACRLRRRGRSRPTRSRAWSATRRLGYSGRSTASVVISPDLRHEQTQADRHEHFVARQRDETGDWQLACLPSSPQYCGATPATPCPSLCRYRRSPAPRPARQATDPPARPAPATAARRPRRRW